jgi:hypothetical protein
MLKAIPVSEDVARPGNGSAGDRKFQALRLTKTAELAAATFEEMVSCHRLPEER